MERCRASVFYDEIHFSIAPLAHEHISLGDGADDYCVSAGFFFAETGVVTGLLDMLAESPLGLDGRAMIQPVGVRARVPSAAMKRGRGAESWGGLNWERLVDRRSNAL